MLIFRFWLDRRLKGSHVLARERECVETVFQYRISLLGLLHQDRTNWVFKQQKVTTSLSRGCKAPAGWVPSESPEGESFSGPSPSFW